MGLEGRLDLRRIDVRAARHDHVAATVGEVEVAVLVDAPEVAERLPAVPRRARLRADVAVGRALAAGRHHVDLADLAHRQLVPLLVEDADLATVGGLAHRARVREPLGARDEGVADALGAAVHLVHALGPEPLDPGAKEPVRAGRAPRDHALERREVVARARLLGQTPDALQHGGHEADPRHPVSLDQRERLLRIEARHQHHEAAEQQRGEGVHEAGRVVLRARDEHGGTRLVAVEGHRRIDPGRQTIDDELRAPRAAAGRERLPRRRGLVGERGVGVIRGLVLAHHLGRRERRVDAGDHRGLRLLENGVALLRGQPPGDRLRDGAELPGREAAHHEGGSVREAHGDVIAEAHAALGEQVGHAVRAQVELAPGEGLAVADQRRLVRLGGGVHGEGGGVGDDGHGNRRVEQRLSRRRWTSAPAPRRSRRG